MHSLQDHQPSKLNPRYGSHTHWTGKTGEVVPASFQAFFATLLALLPGAVYVFTYERQVGSFGVNFTDRVIRFLSASAVFHAVFAFASTGPT